MPSTTISILFVLFFGVSVCRASTGNNLTFYQGSLENYTTRDLENATDILSLLNLSIPTCFYIFGINSDASSAADVLQALLDTREYNVVLLDWSKGADNALFLLPLSYVFVNVPSAEKLGGQFGQVLVDFINNGLEVSNFFLVGHSMGAQIAGEAGRYTKQHGYNLTKIIGLDPAGPLFETILPVNPTLDTSCADFVAIVHTDPNFLSYKEATGHVDYYPNYNSFHTTQPGCYFSLAYFFNATEFSDNISCNHGYSVKLFSASLQYPDLLQSESAASGRAWLRGDGNPSNISTIRVDATEGASGSYFLRTVEDYPYGLGAKGITAE